VQFSERVTQLALQSLSFEQKCSDRHQTVVAFHALGEPANTVKRQSEYVTTAICRTNYFSDIIHGRLYSAFENCAVTHTHTHACTHKN
jgi:hypothetical protein